MVSTAGIFSFVIDHARFKIVQSSFCVEDSWSIVFMHNAWLIADKSFNSASPSQVDVSYYIIERLAMQPELLNLLYFLQTET